MITVYCTLSRAFRDIPVSATFCGKTLVIVKRLDTGHAIDPTAEELRRLTQLLSEYAL